MGIKSDLKIVINSAMTIDGKISSHCGDSNISSSEDLKRLHRLRSQVDAIVVGINTVIADDPMLTIRLVNNKRKSPMRVILDSYGKIPLDSNILKSSFNIRTIIVVTKNATKDNIKKIKNSGASVLEVGSRSVNLQKLFNILRNMGCKKILVEGGGELNWSCLDNEIVSELMVTISPKIIGGRNAITLVEGMGYEKISRGIKLRLMNVQRHKNGEVTLRYKI